MAKSLPRFADLLHAWKGSEAQRIFDGASANMQLQFIKHIDRPRVTAIQVKHAAKQAQELEAKERQRKIEIAANPEKFKPMFARLPA